MQLYLTPTAHGGGVTIKSDAQTARKIERLLVNTALNSHNCHDDGLCMKLSSAFERSNKPKTVDWIILIAGVSALRSSLGYCLSRENHALLCLLEHEVFEAACTFVEDREAVEEVFNQLKISDYIGGAKVESRTVYLYLLKTQEARKAELLNIIKSLNVMQELFMQDYNERFEGLNFSIFYTKKPEPFALPL